MIDPAHPEPQAPQDDTDRSIGSPAGAEREDDGHQCRQLQRDRRGPYGGVVAREDFEELVRVEREH
jgi:hypothetical protein